MIGEPRWIPELESTALLLQRVFLAEKWMVARLHYGHVDPREAGVGNVVNCGATMYVAPVGLVNAGDPRGAYAEAIDLTGAHQSQLRARGGGGLRGRWSPRPSPPAPRWTTSSRPRSTSRTTGRRPRSARSSDAVNGWTTAPRTDDEERELARVVREAVAPYDSVGPEYRQMSMDARRPSRTKSIEELPVALGLLLAHRGDYRGAVLAAVNYGRDADSIAVMAGAIAAGLGGSGAVPTEWLDEIEAASAMDIRETGRLMADAAADILRADRERALARLAAIDAVAPAVGPTADGAPAGAATTAGEPA